MVVWTTQSQPLCQAGPVWVLVYATWTICFFRFPAAEVLQPPDWPREPAHSAHLQSQRAAACRPRRWERAAGCDVGARLLASSGAGKWRKLLCGTGGTGGFDQTECPLANAASQSSLPVPAWLQDGCAPATASGCARRTIMRASCRPAQVGPNNTLAAKHAGLRMFVHEQAAGQHRSAFARDTLLTQVPCKCIWSCGASAAPPRWLPGECAMHARHDTSAAVPRCTAEDAWLVISILISYYFH